MEMDYIRLPSVQEVSIYCEILNLFTHKKTAPAIRLWGTSLLQGLYYSFLRLKRFTLTN